MKSAKCLLRLKMDTEENKMSARNWQSSGVKGSSGDIVKQGYLKKLKTMKKKYFVLRGDSADASARLEYYDSEKKWKANHAPKRSITLKTCFNINKRTDTRQKWVIALYTKKDCFCIVLENEEEMEEWLKSLLELQLGEVIPEGEPIKPTFEHVWKVTVLDKELGGRAGISGLYLLCLTDQTLSLVKVADDDKLDTIEFSLQKIRRCGHVDSFFYMEVGQCTVTGAGNLWMQTEDTNIAENMHTTIFSACRNCSKKDMQPKSRNRSSSANEASKPISLQRWPTHTEDRVVQCIPESSTATTSPSYSYQLPVLTSGSVPTSVFNTYRTCLVRNPSERRHSVAASSGSSGEGSGGVYHQRTYSFPLSPLPPNRGPIAATRPPKFVTSNCNQSSLTGVRDRCDSLPSRARTTSEGATHLPHPARTHLVPLHSRPHSMFNRGISYSPPVASSPVSPASNACSTDSAESSLSMDNDTTDGAWDESGRYGHSLTPDEPVILEENADDYAHWLGEEEKLNNNVHMDRSLCLPIHPTTLNNATYRKQSPNPSSSGFKSSSPSQGSYLEMCSPCGSSPLDTPGTYLPMSPGECRSTLYGRNGSANHSRGSSLAEDGYVHMAPTASDDGYVDMDQKTNHRNQKPERYQSGDTSAGSSCSITSGTPSTDIRFIEYTLDKVATYFPPDEDIGPAKRPTRAYSVGSRPVNNNARHEAYMTSECERARSYSFGSKKPHDIRMMGRGGPMRNHQPLSSSHSSVEPSDDMMELDFTKKAKNKHRKKPSSIERLSVPIGSASTLSSAASSYSTAEGSYMEMSPRASPSLAPSPPKSSLPSRLSAFLGKSPPKPTILECPFSKSSPPVSGYPSPSLGRVPEMEPGYMDMTSGSKGELMGASPPSRIISKSPPDDPYVEMKPGSTEAKQVLAKNTKARIESFPGNESLRPQQFPKTSSPPIKPALLSAKVGKDDYLDMSLKRKTNSIEDNNNSKVMVGRNSQDPKNADGYVEMSLGTSKAKDKTGENEPNYMNMTGRKERKGSRKDRNRYSSQPITIQSTPKESSPIFMFATRKHSTGTPPKVPSYLPLSSSGSPSSSPHSSLPRTRRKNSTRRDSKDTGSGLITPTGSTSTIFPFSLNSPTNSPASGYDSSKCLVDATSGTVRISYTPNEPESSSSPVKPPKPSDKSVSDDYVNFQPRKSVEESDYLPMQPGHSTEPTRKTSAPIFGSSKLRTMEKLLSGLGSLTVSSPAIVTIPAPSASASDSDYLTASCESRLNDEDVNGVNKDVKSVSRTSSVSSVGDKELHYASLDLKRSGSESEETTQCLKTQTSLTESSSASSPSPNLIPDSSSAFTYAEIDFAASSKVRH